MRSLEAIFGPAETGEDGESASRGSPPGSSKLVCREMCDSEIISLSMKGLEP
jgi:hypothetical protein